MKTNVVNEIVLTKESTQNEIKTYFERVLELKRSNENFPINLDEVWMLVYSGRNKAVRALKDNFIENEDYIPLAQNGQRSKDGKFSKGNQTDYFLSVSCLEYFIARKVRPVFEVYRKVFHKATEQKALSQIDLIIQSAIQLKEQEQRLSAVESKVDTLLQIQQEAESELKALPIANEALPELSMRDKIRMLVNRYCSATGLFQQIVWDNVYQKLYYNYHIALKNHSKAKNESWLDVAERKGYLDYIHTIISNLMRDRGLVA